MVCCSTSCGSGCGGGYGAHGGYGGYGGASGNYGTVVDVSPTKEVVVQPGNVMLMAPAAYMRDIGGVNICCQCVCVPECCLPHCFGNADHFGYYGNRGNSGGGLKCKIEDETYKVRLPAACMVSRIHCAKTHVSCCDSPCGPN